MLPLFNLKHNKCLAPFLLRLQSKKTLITHGVCTKFPVICPHYILTLLTLDPLTPSHLSSLDKEWSVGRTFSSQHKKKNKHSFSQCLEPLRQHQVPRFFRPLCCVTTQHKCTPKRLHYLQKYSEWKYARLVFTHSVATCIHHLSSSWSLHPQSQY